MILQKVYRKLEPMSSKAGIITLFLLAYLVLLSMMLFTFPRINAQFGTQAFDLKTFGYSPAEAAFMLQNLDQSTIGFYLFPQLFFLDILYPILLALFLSAVIIRLSVLIKIRTNHILSNLYLLPFIAMFMDYLENGMISVMITNSTDVSVVVVKSASILTQMKGAFTTLSWIIILVLIGICLKNKWHHSRM